MTRLLIVNPTLGIGGVERKIADIARCLSERQDKNLRVDLILEDKPTEASQSLFYQLVQQSSVHIHFKPALPFVSFFLYLMLYLVRRRPDAILAFSRRPSVLALTAAALLPGYKPRILLGNDSIASRALELYVPNPMLRRILKTQMQWLYPRAALILVPSETSKRDLIENFHLSPDKIRVLKNWTRQIPAQCVPKKFDVIYAGRVDRVKRITRLIEIIARIRPALGEIRVVIVGDGSEMDHVRHSARAHHLEHQIEFAGFQEDVGIYFARSKVFCLTSQFEGLPIAALEAMAYGLPVVTVAYAGADELVQNGKTGYICATDDEFSAALYKLLTDEPLRTRMGSCAREFVERAHGEAVLSEYVNLILNHSSEAC